MAKGEKNEEDLNKGDLIELIKAASNFLIAHHGPNPKLQERKSLADLIHKEFSQLDPRMIFKKLTQRAKNLNRLPKVKKYINQAKVHISTISSSDKNYCNGLGVDLADGEGQNNDYDELLTAYKIK